MVSTAIISQYVEGIDFPASKEDVLEYVSNRNAPAQVVNALQKMPGEKYSSMAGIWHAVGKVS